jgi:gliding motility-associated-like protein
VQVTNSSGCVASDTVDVVAIYPSPAGFIFADTAICLGETVLLKPFQDFAEYLWSTGSTLSSLPVKDPGEYLLMVTDFSGCKSSASIVVNDKDCINQLIFPSAFTPNGDGKNDIFLPFVSGLLSQYELTVYNRWGEVVFRTNDHLKGWPGFIRGKSQDTGTFIWVCRFQFNNQHYNLQKGVITQIR